MATKEYKCVKETKNSLSNALIELSTHMPLNKISVKQICENAKLSRNAFYFHYKDINSLIEEILENMIGDVENMFDDIKAAPFPDNVLVVVEKLTDYFINRRNAALMLIDSSYSAAFTKRIDEAFSNFYYNYYIEFNPKGGKQIYDFFYGFISNGFYGMLIQWLRNPEGISKRHFVRLAYTFLHKLLVPTTNK